jgi:hypothetical protein
MYWWRPQSVLMRPSVIPQALNGQPFRAADALALGVSLKTLQGSRFRRLSRGVYVAATAPDTHRIHVRGVMLMLPPGTIATGVTGLQMLGLDVGSQLPMTFATTHLRQVRRHDVKVMRLKQLPACRDGVASPEQCWLVAALSLNLLELVTAGDSLLRLRRTTLVRPAVGGRGVFRTRGGRRSYRRKAGTRPGRLTARDLAATVPGLRRTTDAGMQSDDR